MPNGTEYVDWKTFNNHVDDSKEGYERLGSIEAEVMGDSDAGRPSLRMELSAKVEQATKELRKTRNSVWISLIILILGMAIKAIIDHNATQEMIKALLK